MKFRQSTIKDIHFLIDNIDSEHKEIALDFYGKQWDEILKRQLDIGAFTAYDNPEVPLAIFGIHKLWDKVGQIYLIKTEGFNINKYSCTKHCKLFFNILSNQMNFHRIQTPILSTANNHINLIEWLGFKKECLMQKYSPSGKDYYLYSLVEETN